MALFLLYYYVISCIYKWADNDKMLCSYRLTSVYFLTSGPHMKDDKRVFTCRHWAIALENCAY